jgi:hypothetical protein
MATTISLEEEAEKYKKLSEDETYPDDLKSYFYSLYLECIFKSDRSGETNNE